MNIFKTVKYLYPDASFYVKGNDYATLDMENKPTLEELEAAWPVVQKQMDNDAHNFHIKAQLEKLDAKRIRPLAEGDSVKLAEINAEAVKLRALLK